MTEISPTSAPGAAILATGLVTAIDHVGIAVPDLDAALTWYAENLGLVSTHEEVNEEQGVREAMLSVPGSPEGATQIQLLAPLNENSTIAKFLDRSGPGLQQLAYRVSDLDAVSAALRANGVRLLYDAPRRGTADSRINFLHPKDAGGSLAALVAPAAHPAHTPRPSPTRFPALQRRACAPVRLSAGAQRVFRAQQVDCRHGLRS